MADRTVEWQDRGYGLGYGTFFWDQVPHSQESLLRNKTKSLTKHSRLQSHRLLGQKSQVNLGRVEFSFLVRCSKVWSGLFREDSLFSTGCLFLSNLYVDEGLRPVVRRPCFYLVLAVTFSYVILNKYLSISFHFLFYKLGVGIPGLLPSLGCCKKQEMISY